MEYMKKALCGGGALLAVVALAALMVNSGCDSSTPTGQAQIASSIQLGASTATSLGLVAIPDAAEANAIAAQAAQVLDQNVLPILNGQVSGVTNGLQDVLNLNAFNAPSLAKVKLIVQSALPLLEAYLPADILSQQLDKVDPAVLADIRGFFQGVRNGISSYTGTREMTRNLLGRDYKSFQDLRLKLAAKP